MAAGPKKIKLSLPQIRLLAKIDIKGSVCCVPYYSPAKALVSKGVCEWGAGGRLKLTPTGRDWVVKNQTEVNKQKNREDD